MKRHYAFQLMVVLLLMVFTSACSGRDIPVTSSQPTPTSPPAQEPTPTNVPALAPTSTTAPTPTLEPTYEPTLEATEENVVGARTTEKEFETLDPTNFETSTNIDNPWMPLKPGMRFVYEGVTVEDGETSDHRLEFTVTGITKEISGVQTVVAWILDYQDDQIVEKEISFYAQDNEGTVWYLGEHPEEYEQGEFVKASTWIDGLVDAHAGIKMPSKPQLGEPSFSQGWAPEVDFRDRGLVSQMGLKDCVPVKCYTDVLVVDEFTAVEPNAFQLKYYALGVGNIRVGWRGDDTLHEELELVEFTQLGVEELAKINTLALELEKHAYEVSKDVYAQTKPAK